MPIDFLYPEFEVVRNPNRCIACRVCERQCANGVHYLDDGVMMADESKCVNCHRCVSLCPTRALKIVKSDHGFRENGNWNGQAISEVYRQAGTGGVLLSSMGNPKEYPCLLYTSCGDVCGWESGSYPPHRNDDPGTTRRPPWPPGRHRIDGTHTDPGTGGRCRSRQNRRPGH